MNKHEITQPDLFGGETRVVTGKKSYYQERRLKMNYRRATEKNKNCSTCNMSFMRFGGRHYYRKCKIIGCSASTATDVSRNYVCNEFCV